MFLKRFYHFRKTKTDLFFKIFAPNLFVLIGILATKINLAKVSPTYIMSDSFYPAK